MVVTFLIPKSIKFCYVVYHQFAIYIFLYIYFFLLFILGVFGYLLNNIELVHMLYFIYKNNSQLKNESQVSYLNNI